jgi:hypothetical protein
MAGSGSQTDLNESVEFSFGGRTKFKVNGSYFHQLGRERSSQNPADMIRTFPENLTTPTGDRTFPEWTGAFSVF